jgi:hypothetical protein
MTSLLNFGELAAIDPRFVSPDEGLSSPYVQVGASDATIIEGSLRFTDTSASYPAEGISFAIDMDVMNDVERFLARDSKFRLSCVSASGQSVPVDGRCCLESRTISNQDGLCRVSIGEKIGQNWPANVVRRTETMALALTKSEFVR